MATRHDDLLDAAAKLFQQHGFHATSIEAITSACGISKGAFYKHFDSKENMMLELVQRYYDDIFTEADRYAEALSHAPLLKLKKKMAIEIEKSIEYRSFFYALIMEFPPHMKGPVPEFLKQIHTDHQQWHTNAILEAFGSETAKYAKDLTIIMEGILRSYLMAIAWQQSELSSERLADFVVDCLHIIAVNGDQLSPVMLSYSENEFRDETLIDTIRQDIQRLYTEAGNPETDNFAEQKDVQTMALLMDELDQDNPREFLIDALLQRLHQRSDFRKHLTKILTNWEMWKGDWT
ncbi:TetR/AcrR family transcriptional regulator [Lentibacillus halophilus]|uniref:TetR/AcrR family transcriptional regulator n=1 Tax=Lentibacillus halophilus TaxID=295065 RepID=A0ABN0Z965_9BACI